MVPTVDAGSLADADPSCVRWQLVDVPVASVSLMESMPVHPQRSARLLARTVECPGDEPATPSVGFTLENEFLLLRMRVWRPVGVPACAAPSMVERPVTVRFPYAGTWTVTATEQRVVDVVAAPTVGCGGTTTGCALDCDCAGRARCLSTTGFGGPFLACVRPCEYDRDCLGDGTCVSIADSFAFACESGTAECDGVTRLCPRGFSCVTGTCAPDFTLGSATRRACTCDAECEAPLRCVWPEGASEGRCDIACPTSGAGWCQGAHVCTPDPSAVEGGDSICAWVGE